MGLFTQLSFSMAGGEKPGMMLGRHTMVAGGASSGVEAEPSERAMLGQRTRPKSKRLQKQKTKDKDNL